MFRRTLIYAGKLTYYFTNIDELKKNTVVVEDMKVCKLLLESLLSPCNGAKYKKICDYFLFSTWYLSLESHACIRL